MAKKVPHKRIMIPKVEDESFLLFAQSPTHIPFVIKRIFYIIKPMNKSVRGFHSHHKTKQVLFCIQGRVRIIIKDGINEEEVILTKPEEGLFIDRHIWIEMYDFSEETILLVLASEPYDIKDYIREYDTIKKIAHDKKKNNSSQ